MALILDKNIFFARFVSCVRAAGLLRILPEAAGCAKAGGTFLISPVGFGFSDDFKPALPDAKNLTRCGIFRGKISQPKTQTNKNRLEERTLPAPNS
jgi:hypothetical protein